MLQKGILMDGNMFNQQSHNVKINHYSKIFKLWVTNDYADVASSNQHLVQPMHV